AALLVGACGGGGSSSGSGTTLEVTLTNDGCKPSQESVPAGPLTVHVTNKDGDKVSEVELVKDDIILGEKENLAPALSGSFSVNLSAGDYELSWPGAANETAALKATGSAAKPSVKPELQSALTGASTSYKTYVQGQVGDLVAKTQTFVDAVHAGDIAAA